MSKEELKELAEWVRVFNKWGEEALPGFLESYATDEYPEIETIDELIDAMIEETTYYALTGKRWMESSLE